MLKRSPVSSISVSAPRTASEDLELVRAALRGDSEATRELVRRLECVARILDSLNTRASRPLPRVDLEDAAQSTALVVWKKLASFEGRARLETWVYRIAYLEFMNLYRRIRREDVRSAVALGFDDDASLLARPEPDLLEIEELELAVNGLPPPAPDIIRLKHHQALTFREIGERLGIPANSAKTWYYRGLDELRAAFASGHRAGGSHERA